MAKLSQDTLVYAMSALHGEAYREKREAEKMREFAAIDFLPESTRDGLLEAAARCQKRMSDFEAAHDELRIALHESGSEEISEQDKYVTWYPLLRRIVLAQIKGDYEAAERFTLIMQEHGSTPKNEVEFDKFMELAAKAMGARS